LYVNHVKARKQSKQQRLKITKKICANLNINWNVERKHQLAQNYHVTLLDLNFMVKRQTLKKRKKTEKT